MAPRARARAQRRAPARPPPLALAAAVLAAASALAAAAAAGGLPVLKQHTELQRFAREHGNVVTGVSAPRRARRTPRAA